MAMATPTRGQRRRLEEEDRISGLPDAILGEIISLLPTIDGACTQAVSSRWRHLWRSAPLNLDLHEHPPTWRRIPFRDISGILSAHSGPGRRFAVPMRYLELEYTKDPAATLDGWLRSPALDNLQEIEFDFGSVLPGLPRHPPLPASVRRFSSTLRVVSFGGCKFPGGALHLPLLEQLSLLNVKILEESLYALLDGCPALESLMLSHDLGCSRIRIVFGTLRSIGVRPGFEDITLEQFIIEDAPRLERLIICGTGFDTHTRMVVSVISAPKLRVLGQLPADHPRLEFGTTTFKGSHVVKSMTAVNNVKVLALTHIRLSLDSVINFMKCLPCLEKLYIKMSKQYEPEEPAETNVLTTYRGNKAHVNFAKFFVLNARVLESMVLEERSSGGGDVAAKRSKAAVDDADGGEDRLSALPDDVLVLILLHLGTTDAARTSVLSRRWRRIWTLLPDLRFGFARESQRLWDVLSASDVPLRYLLVGVPDPSPESLTAWLLAAARRVSGELLLVNLFHENNADESEEEEEEATERGSFMLPCFEKATSISFDLGFLGISVPPNGVVARLTERSLSNLRFHGPGDLGDAVSSPRCPCLQKLIVCNTRGLDRITIDSESLQVLELKNPRGLRQLTVVAPELRDLSVMQCFLNDQNQPIVNISAPQLELLTWVDKYDPSSVHLGNMERLQTFGTSFFVYGPHGFTHNRACLMLLPRFKAIENLTLSLVYMLDQEEIACSSGCICDKPTVWKTEELSLNHLQELEIQEFKPSEHEVAFVKRLLNWATVLKMVTVTFHHSIIDTKAKEFSQMFRSLSKPGICMKFYIYQKFRLVLYAPED